MAIASIIGIAIGANISTHILPRVRDSTIKALLLAIFSFLAYRMLLTGLRRGNIFVMPSTIENITAFLVLVICLAILMALRKYISE
jgi:predicted tellurium resistance membrane protein TerC